VVYIPAITSTAVLEVAPFTPVPSWPTVSLPQHLTLPPATCPGADGSPAPAGNAGFLRPDAELAIVMLTNEDDCSAPASASPLPVYSLGRGGMQSIQNPDGPIANYRCNGGPLGGHLCNDPTAVNPTVFAQPPLNPPADAVGDPPTLSLTSCESNDTGSSGLLPVSSLVAEIKALKSQPGPDIVVGAIMAPATPYVVEWLPSTGAFGNELWPSVEHSCGSVSDGSFGDPPVRIAQFVQAFGDDGVTGSICDDSYQAAFELIASKIASHLLGASSGTGGQDGGSGDSGLGRSSGSAETTPAGSFSWWSRERCRASPGGARPRGI
jgi:hypothetical protein